jgi:Phosphodiester glycosidase
LYRLAWARTAIGIAPGRRVCTEAGCAGGYPVAYLVAADAEGINGGNGATMNQMGRFFKDELGATAAMSFDGGLSTEMVLRGANGTRRINSIAYEGSHFESSYPSTIGDGYPGGPGSVGNYLAAWGVSR